MHLPAASPVPAACPNILGLVSPAFVRGIACGALALLCFWWCVGSPRPPPEAGRSLCRTGLRAFTSWKERTRSLLGGGPPGEREAEGEASRLRPEMAALAEGSFAYLQYVGNDLWHNHMMLSRARPM